jgi:hypothetical protein
MVDPSERGLMTKAGVMAQLTKSFLEIHQGLAGMPLCFGFPSTRAMRLGERSGLYTEVGGIREVRWGTLPDRPHVMTQVRHLNTSDVRDARIIDQIWAAMAADFRDNILVVRDARYVRERYVAHPSHRYQLLLVTNRLTQAPLGVLVLRELGPDAELLDLVGPLKAYPQLVDQARRLARRWGKQSVYGWFPETYAELMAGSQGLTSDIGVRIPTNAWVYQDFDPAALQDRWWLTSGDTDFH